jgi:hypothetical protein
MAVAGHIAPAIARNEATVWLQMVGRAGVRIRFGAIGDASKRLIFTAAPHGLVLGITKNRFHQNLTRIGARLKGMGNATNVGKT